jgi:dihydroorotase
VLDLRALRAVDPTAFESQARNTPFEGMRLKGWPMATIVGGEIVWRSRPPSNQ